MGDRLRAVRSLEALAVTIVCNLSFNLLKHRVVHGNFVAMWKIVRTGAEGVPTDAASDLERVEGLMAQLPLRQREVLRLRHLEGLETEEIAALLGMTPDAVRMNLSRARKRIRTLFFKG